MSRKQVPVGHEYFTACSSSVIFGQLNEEDLDLPPSQMCPLNYAFLKTFENTVRASAGAFEAVAMGRKK
jgi:hypothetical protein